jgi:hypothetical protein
MTDQHQHIHESLRHLAVAVSTLSPDPKNARKHDRRNLDAIKSSLEQFGFRQPIIVQKQGMIVRAGNGRLEVSKELGWSHVPALVVDESEAEAVAFAIADNRTAELAEWDFGNLAAALEGLQTSGLDIEALGWTEDETSLLLSDFDLDDDTLLGGTAGSADGKGGDDEKEEIATGSMALDFGAPPFSVLDARQGYWKKRKDQWLAYGIRSEAGRGDDLAFRLPDYMNRGTRRMDADQRSNLTGAAPMPEWAYQHGNLANTGVGTSIFDPVLTELLVRWFSAENAVVFDPFAGGSVRGIVSAKLGRDYTGIELRGEQVEENRAQAKIILSDEDGAAAWVVGDSQHSPTLLPPEYEADMILSCPPYYDLEQYSDDPADISNAGTYEDFLTTYRVIIKNAVARLKDNRFACWVVGDVRGKDGAYCNFVSDTIQAFIDAGMQLWNEAILVTPVGSLPLRAARPFRINRKLGKTHQNVLIFFKGDPTAIKDDLGELSPEAFLHDGDESATAADVEVDTDAQAAAWLDEDHYVDEQTPVQAVGNFFVKRDDLFRVAGVPGGKVRSCWHLCRQATAGLVTAGSRQSPQVNIVARLARKLGLPCRVHVPSGAMTPELIAARQAGAEIIQHRPGYNTVIVARARDDAEARGWTEIPFGMECQEAVTQTRAQVPEELPAGVTRVVVPVGSGMSLAGVLHGLRDRGWDVPVLGVRVGADPTKRLDEFAPAGWREQVEIVESGLDYHDHAPEVMLGDVELDPVYEAKCIPFLEPGDLLWVVGIRQTAA